MNSQRASKLAADGSAATRPPTGLLGGPRSAARGANSAGIFPTGGVGVELVASGCVLKHRPADGVRPALEESLHCFEVVAEA